MSAAFKLFWFGIIAASYSSAILCAALKNSVVFLNKSKFIFMNETLTEDHTIIQLSAESESLIQVHSGQTTEGGEIQ